MKKEFDVLVIGAGPGGYTAAIRAAQLGGKVAIIEKQDLGGTCLNKGCIPTKALIASVHTLHCLKKAEEFGIIAKNVKIDFSAIMTRKERIVKRLRTGIKNLLKSYHIEVIKGQAYFVSPSTIKIEDKTLDIKKCIIATGSVISEMLGIKIDGQNIITSDDVIELEQIPSSLLIVGGGVIGLEFACIFQGLGSKVTIAEALSSILSSEDREISKALKSILAKRGMDIKTKTTVKEINLKDGKVEVVLNSGENIEKILVEKVVITIGRKPQINNLGLENAGIFCEDGRIVVNNKMETNIKGIYAIGDVIGGPFLAHKASAEGIVAAENALGRETLIDYRAIPRCIFTIPEIASVGISEEEARKKGYKVAIGKFPFMVNGKAITTGDTTGFVKVVVDRETNAILGIHILGLQATELITQASLAIRLGCTINELNRIIYPHPTLSEAIWEAAQDVYQKAIDLPKFKGS